MDTFIIRRVKESLFSLKEGAACVFFGGDSNQRKHSQLVDLLIDVLDGVCGWRIAGVFLDSLSFWQFIDV